MCQDPLSEPTELPVQLDPAHEAVVIGQVLRAIRKLPMPLDRPQVEHRIGRMLEDAQKRAAAEHRGEPIEGGFMIPTSDALKAASEVRLGVTEIKPEWMLDSFGADLVLAAAELALVAKMQAAPADLREQLVATLKVDPADPDTWPISFASFVRQKPVDESGHVEKLDLAVYRCSACNGAIPIGGRYCPYCGGHQEEAEAHEGDPPDDEDLVLANDPEFVESRKEAEQDLAAGRTRGMNELFNELDEAEAKLAEGDKRPARRRAATSKPAQSRSTAARRRRRQQQSDGEGEGS